MTARGACWRVQLLSDTAAVSSATAGALPNVLPSLCPRPRCAADLAGANPSQTGRRGDAIQ